MNPRSDIIFFMRIEPDIPKLTHQNGIKVSAVNGKPMVHKTQELKNLEAKYVSLLKEHAPEKPWNCPIALHTFWFFKKPKSAKGLYKTTKPDTDNLIKTLKDCMKTAGYFTDDALVVEDHVRKLWAKDGEYHGIGVHMEDMSEENQ